MATAVKMSEDTKSKLEELQAEIKLETGLISSGVKTDEEDIDEVLSG